jgi:hypothetical protein
MDMSSEVQGANTIEAPWRVEEAYSAEVELESARWKAITAFVDLLSDDERLAPGYYRGEPDWTVKDLIAHFGRWMREARVQLLDIGARSYVPHEVDIEAINAETLAEYKSQPWEQVWSETNDARAWMLEAWFGLRSPDEAANQWIRKAGAEHYGEHIVRLRDWVHELVDLRNRPVVDEWEG